MVADNPNRIVILMYHGLDSADEPSGLTSKGELAYVVREEDFKKQMAHIAEQKIVVIKLEGRTGRVTSPESGPDQVSIILTFDDGHVSNYTMALPVLKQYGFKGYFFITTDRINESHHLTDGMIRELHAAGMVIGSHGKTHSFLPDLSREETELELKSSRTRLEEIIQAEVSCFSAPGGRIDDRVAGLAVEAGYSLIFDSRPRVNISMATEKTIGRFAVRRSQSFSEFAKIAAGRPPITGIVKFEALKLVKSVLGNRAYDAVRKIFLGKA